jgi:hypothetical protein
MIDILANLIIPLGILTYLSLILGIISGLKRWRLKRHKTIAIIAIILATLHASLVIYFNL